MCRDEQLGVTPSRHGRHPPSTRTNPSHHPSTSLAPTNNQTTKHQQADEFDSSNSSSGGVSARDQWVLCPDPLPEVPEGARLMASEHLPISV